MSRTSTPARLSRRALLRTTAAAGGAFVMGSFVPFDRAVAAGELAKGPIDPNVFLRIAPDNTITVISKHFEMGQGVTTGIATLIAEELGADWSQIHIEFAPVNERLYANLLLSPAQATGSTTSIANCWEQMRQVGAAARHMFVTAAAASWKVPATEIVIEKSVVLHRRSRRRATLGALAPAAMRVPVPAEVALKAPKDWTLIGTRVARVDSVSKSTGTAVYGLDVRRPDMLTAMVRRPEQFGATVASFDASEALKVPGVVEVVPVPSGVAVLARDTWSAIRGRAALKVTWDTSRAEMRSTAEILAEYRRMASSPGLSAANRGDASAGLARATRTIEAEYTFPYLAHAPMEPLNGTIQLHDLGAEIWSGCQAPTIDKLVAARVLGLKPEQISINTMLGGGSFGRRAVPIGDWTNELAQIAKAKRSRAPVRVVWTREDDIKGGFYRPLVLHQVRAGIDREGRIAGWQHKLVCRPIFLGTPLERGYVKDGIDRSTVEGLADTPYALGNFSVQAHNAASPLATHWWRSVGHTHTAQVVETVVDELAHLAGRDPVAFRLDLLRDAPRDAGVLRLAAEKAGWSNALPRGRGRGIAVHRSFGTHVAMVAEVTVTGADIKVDRIVAAVDCGVAVNPDVVEAQIEGAVGFALSSVLRNAITLTEGRVDQSNFDDYEPTRMSEMPRVKVHIVPSTATPTGIGEPGVPPLAPAITNAVFAATGKRLRSLPLNARQLS